MHFFLGVLLHNPCCFLDVVSDFYIFGIMGKNVTLSLALESGRDAGSPLHGFASAADHFGREGLKFCFSNFAFWGGIN